MGRLLCDSRLHRLPLRLQSVPVAFVPRLNRGCADDLTLILEIGAGLPPFTGADLVLGGGGLCDVVEEQPFVWDTALYPTIEDFAAYWPTKYVYAPFATVVGRVITIDFAAWIATLPPEDRPFLRSVVCSGGCFRYNWFPPQTPQPLSFYTPHWTIVKQPACCH